jgi:hypothetical protein
LNWTALRFALRRQRLELVLFSLVLLSLIGLATWMAVGISALGLEDCYVEPARVAAEECTRRFMELSRIAQAMPIVQALAVFAPPLAGVFLGATILAREVESGTAIFAWTFSASRTRWLVGRVLPAATLLLVLCLAAGAAVDTVYASSFPIVPIEASLVDFQLRGPLLAARALLAFAASVLVGAVVGRLLPSLLLSIVVSGALIAGSMWLAQSFAMREPVAEPGPGGLLVGSLYRAPNGEVLDGTQAVERMEEFGDGELFEVYEIIDLGVPGSRSIAIVTTVLGAITVVILALGGMTLATVNRRRPY